MISIDLSGKSILITGALGAIAEPMVRKLVEAGATLILLDIKPEDSGQANSDVTGKFRPHHMFTSRLTSRIPPR